MKRVILIIAILLVAVGCSVIDSDEAAVKSSGFSLDLLPEEISLADALRLYPEIYDIYGLQPVSDKDAEQGIRNGIDVIDGKDINAKDFLSNLNFRTSSCQKQSNPAEASEAETQIEPQTASETEGLIEPLFQTTVFSSVKELAAHEKEKNWQDCSVFPEPQNWNERFQLARISLRENSYVMTEYQAAPDEALLKGLSAYDAERMQYLICKMSLFPDAEADLRINYIEKGFRETAVNGKTVYRWDEHAEGDPAKQTIGYEIAFIENGKVVFMHLPALGSFEEMAQYLELNWIDLKSE